MTEQRETLCPRQVGGLRSWQTPSSPPISRCKCGVKCTHHRSGGAACVFEGASVSTQTGRAGGPGTPETMCAFTNQSPCWAVNSTGPHTETHVGCLLHCDRCLH